MARLPRVYLCRHGETEWSLNGRHTGKSDIPLTAHGEEVIKKSAPTYCGKGKLLDPTLISHVFCSPRKRAQRTFELMNEASDTPFEKERNDIQVTEDVAEWDYGDYEGLKTHEIHGRHPNWSIWSDGCPNGESSEEMCKRVDTVIQKIADMHDSYTKRCVLGDEKQEGGADVLIVSHGHFSRCFMARWSRLPLDRGEVLVVDAGSVNIGGYQHSNISERSLLGLNLHSYLL